MDDPKPPGRAERAFAVLNPASGSADDGVRKAIEREFGGVRAPVEFHETAEDEDMSAVVGDAVGRGADLIIAAGGDGTVSAVANGLVGANNGDGRGAVLGIVPLGTANVLARELGMPLDVEIAAKALAGPHELRSVDAMRIDGRCYFTQVGVGIDALMIRDTDTATKKRFGRAAYIWTAITNLIGFEPRRFTLTIDGKVVKRRATQVVVANVGSMGDPRFRWGPQIRVDDGTLDICVVSAKTMFDYAKVVWHVVRRQHHLSPNIRYYHATKSVEIALGKPLPVQADGEVIGDTPVRIDLISGAIRVAVPVGATAAVEEAEPGSPAADPWVP